MVEPNDVDHRTLEEARQAALAAEQEAHRSEARREEWERNGAYLSLEELRSGRTCYGCGQAFTNSAGTEPSTPERPDQAEARVREQHSECGAGFWTVSGSRSLHCHHCCPPPPMSDEKLSRLRALFAPARSGTTDDEDIWRLQLTCDHIVEQTQRRSHSSWTLRTVSCDACGLTRGVVHAERSGPSERRRLAAELTAATAKITQQRKATAKAEQRAEQLRAQLAQLERLPTDSP